MYLLTYLRTFQFTIRASRN